MCLWGPRGSLEGLSKRGTKMNSEIFITIYFIGLTLTLIMAAVAWYRWMWEWGRIIIAALIPFVNLIMPAVFLTLAVKEALEAFVNKVDDISEALRRRKGD